MVLVATGQVAADIGQVPRTAVVQQGQAMWYIQHWCNKTRPGGTLQQEQAIWFIQHCQVVHCNRSKPCGSYSIGATRPGQV
eukprot:1377272-Amorphochlora_amoeboformis.AAC.1